MVIAAQLMRFNCFVCQFCSIKLQNQCRCVK